MFWGLFVCVWSIEAFCTLVASDVEDDQLSGEDDWLKFSVDPNLTLQGCECVLCPNQIKSKTY